MRKSSIARLFLLLIILALSMMPAPSHAFPLCPWEACYWYRLSCEGSGGVASFSYYGWCQDENYYLRGYAEAYCKIDGSVYGLGQCADR